ncbi:glycosyltransferase [Marinobacter orientalis]|uniref:Glycosyltransferase n=1 Tax=Marinobacter orientalis TaxID=1928859 RepID=A0A7Y0RCP1_9GAMM|nr:glycosyltransferase [Marinobacter orientalis]NMT63801.1 glycosyltransferase [Marinobacter orientalis]TGX49910.1 glycosyltransferase [Marinobacter orientalis]
MSKRLWITWENHRRSKELASEFSADYYPLVYEAKRPLRYILLTMRTIMVLLNEKPNVVFCQNPSIFLTALLVFLKTIFNYRLVVDRHSNFKFEHKNSSSIKWRIFQLLSKWTIKKADLTIVTNKYLQNICNGYGGNAIILQDKIPNLSRKLKRSPPSFMREMKKPQVMFVTMFDPDEPVDEIIKAGKNLSDCVCYLSGNYKKYYSSLEAEKLLDSNIVLTGYVSDEDYLSLMENSDLVVVLTKKDFILNCGGYEAIAMNKPLILSDTPTLRSYFGSAAKYTKCRVSEIQYKIMESVNNTNIMIENTTMRKLELEDSWTVKFGAVSDVIDDIVNKVS